MLYPSFSEGSLNWLDWEYLGDGVQMIPVMAGVLAVPELLSAYRMKAEKIRLMNGVIVSQLMARN